MSSPPNTHSICIFGHRPKQFVLFKHIHKVHSILHTKFGGGGQQARQCMFHLPSPPHNHSMCIFRHRPNNLYSSNKYTRSSILSKTRFGGGGEQRSPRVSPRESLRNPIGGPSEHHRDPHGNPIAIPLPHGAPKVPNWESRKHPMGIPMESP